MVWKRKLYTFGGKRVLLRLITLLPLKSHVKEKCQIGSHIVFDHIHDALAEESFDDLRLHALVMDV